VTLAAPTSVPTRRSSDLEVAIRQVGELGRERQAADRPVLRLAREPPLLDATREIAVDRRLSPFAELVADFAPDRLEAGLHAHLRSEEHTSELQSPDHLVC